MVIYTKKLTCFALKTVNKYKITNFNLLGLKNDDSTSKFEVQILKITKADQTHFLVSFRLEEGLLTFYMQNNDLRTFMITGLNFKFSIKKSYL